jgi:hypothetical protein
MNTCTWCPICRHLPKNFPGVLNCHIKTHHGPKCSALYEQYRRRRVKEFVKQQSASCRLVFAVVAPEAFAFVLTFATDTLRKKWAGLQRGRIYRSIFIWDVE